MCASAVSLPRRGERAVVRGVRASLSAVCPPKRGFPSTRVLPLLQQPAEPSRLTSSWSSTRFALSAAISTRNSSGFVQCLYCGKAQQQQRFTTRGAPEEHHRSRAHGRPTTHTHKQNRHIGGSGDGGEHQQYCTVLYWCTATTTTIFTQTTNKGTIMTDSSEGYRGSVLYTPAVGLLVDHHCGSDWSSARRSCSAVVRAVS